MAKRVVVCDDALNALRVSREKDGLTSGVGAIVTSLPDAAEMGLKLPDWMDWFYTAAKFCIQAAGNDCPCIFYQTDRKSDGRLMSKPMLIYEAVNYCGANVLWHKIVLRREVGKVDVHRPGYSHLIAVSRAAKPGKATPDVIPVSRPVYPNGMPMAAAFFAVGYARRYSTFIKDPFCGRGTVLAMAERFGFESITGIDIDPKQCKHAEALQISDELLNQLITNAYALSESSEDDSDGAKLPAVEATGDAAVLYNVYGLPVKQPAPTPSPGFDPEALPL